MITFEEAWDLFTSGPLMEEYPKLAAEVAQVICRLPEDVQKFALHKCSFVGFSRYIYGRTLPGYYFAHWEGQRRATRGHWVIILSADMPSKEILFTIAHEIAHAWLKHDVMRYAELPDTEGEADAKAVEWGFVEPKRKAARQAKEKSGQGSLE